MFEPIQIINGPMARGVIHRPSDGDRPGVEFAAPKTTLRTHRMSLITTGQVIRAPGGEHYLVAKHSSTSTYKTFHLFEADRQVTWTRVTKTINPVSKQEVAGPPAAVAPPIWVMWERTRREFVDLSVRIGQENYMVATTANVQLGDYVNNKLVKRVSDALGIKVLELQG